VSISPQGHGGGDDGPRGELVAVAFAKDRTEGELIHGLLENAGIPSLLEQVGLNVDGPQLGFGLATRGFGGGPQRVMVHANRAERARALLAETLVEDEEAVTPEIANAEHLEDASGGRARSYGVAGAYARALFWSLGIMGAAFGAFLLLRAV
jgi:Putative prokaryotic signal transducing protein